MRLTITTENINKVYAEAERKLCLSAGFHPDLPILKQNTIDTETGHDAIVFEQDDTPDKGGDNVNCEYLDSLRKE